jgi:hypothetical protein
MVIMSSGCALVLSHWRHLGCLQSVVVHSMKFIFVGMPPQTQKENGCRKVTIKSIKLIHLGFNNLLFVIYIVLP